MFCGNCGAQVPDGSAVCTKCGKQLAPKSKAPQMNQAVQNAGARANGTAGGSGKNFDVKKVGIIAAAVVAVIALVLVLKGSFGGGGIEDGLYINDSSAKISVDGNKMTFYEMGNSNTDVVVKYKIKDDTIVFDPKSAEFSKETLDYLEDKGGYDKDEIKKKLEKYREELEEELTEMDFEYDEEKKYFSLDDEVFYYVENYKVGPSGKFTCEVDEDITITFKDGKVSIDYDGEKETFTYYCFENEDEEVVIKFYGEDWRDSDLREIFDTNKAKFDDDQILIRVDGDEVVFEQ